MLTKIQEAKHTVLNNYTYIPHHLNDKDDFSMKSLKKISRIAEDQLETCPTGSDVPVLTWVGLGMRVMLLVWDDDEVVSTWETSFGAFSTESENLR
jgi:hypothetical protein